MEQPDELSAAGPTPPVLSRRALLSRAAYGIGGVVATGALLAPAHAAAAASRTVAPAPVRPVARLSGAAQPRGVCAGRDALMVVGESATGRAVSWHSPDGRRWREATLPPPQPGEADVWGVAAHGDAFVAVGSLLQQDLARVRPDRSAAGEIATHTVTATRRSPAVWWARDGVAWEGDTVAAGIGAHAQLIAVSCNSDRLVAVGSTLDVDGAQGAAALVLASADGERWEAGEVTGGDALPEGSFTGVTATDEGWLATSTDMRGGAVWASADGRRWAQVPGSSDWFAGLTLQGIAVDGSRIVVAATALADHDTSLHTSNDGGRTWRTGPPRVRALDHADATVTDVAVVAGDVLVVGTRGDAPVIERRTDDVGD